MRYWAVIDGNCNRTYKDNLQHEFYKMARPR